MEIKTTFIVIESGSILYSSKIGFISRLTELRLNFDELTELKNLVGRVHTNFLSLSTVGVDNLSELS